MTRQEKQDRTFRVICAHCNDPFHVRLALADPDAEGDAEVAVECPYCERQVMVPVPLAYVEQDHLVRGIKSLPGGKT